jgi:protein gp37
MLRKSAGNMYEFVDFQFNPVKGLCEHSCEYCYVKRFPIGNLRLDVKELATDLGKDKTIFICSGTDLFQESVPSEWILAVLNICKKYPENTYLFQSKNPKRFLEYLGDFPSKTVLGTTIETNRPYPVSKAPIPEERMKVMAMINKPKFITIEPIMSMDVSVMVDWMKAIKPEWVNIGADSNRNKSLPEPDTNTIGLLIAGLNKAGIKIKLKKNLGRLF